MAEVEAFLETRTPPTTEQLLVAYWLAMESCPMELAYLGIFSNLAGGALAARRQLWQEQGGDKDQTLTLYVDSAKGDTLAELLGVNGDSTGG